MLLKQNDFHFHILSSEQSAEYKYGNDAINKIAVGGICFPKERKLSPFSYQTKLTSICNKCVSLHTIYFYIHSIYSLQYN